MELRTDQTLIAKWIKKDARVLDLGCGDGALLSNLQTNKDVSGYGIEIDENIMQKANLIEGEKVHLLSLTNGERLITYVIKGEKNSNKICVNGPAAKKIVKGHEIIIISYATIDFKEAKKFTPTIIYP